MNLPQRSAEERTRWHNEVPAWIRNDPRYVELGATVRLIVQEIADQCRPDGAGNLTCAFGGFALMERVGCAKSTFWARLRECEAAGWIVCLQRGRTVNGHNYANQYGIPGQPGGLDHCRTRRRQQIMEPGADGRLRPHVLSAGEQLHIPGTSLNHHEYPSGAAQSADTHNQVVRNPDYPRPVSGLPPSGFRTPPMVGVVGVGNGVVARSPRRLVVSGLGKVLAIELHSLPLLLALYERARGCGLVDGSEDAWMRFVAMARHCVRTAERPEAMFAANLRRGLWEHVSAQDEREAAAWLRQAEWGDDGARDTDAGDASDWEDEG